MAATWSPSRMGALVQDRKSGPTLGPRSRGMEGRKWFGFQTVREGRTVGCEA